MENNIELIDGGRYLHCDNPQCGHDMTFEGEFRKELINTPCPKCGQNMLTEEDYEAGKELEGVLPDLINLTNSLTEKELNDCWEKALEEFPELENIDPEELMKGSIHIHNNKLTINIDKNEE